MLNLILILICLSISYFIIDALIKDVHNKALPKKVPIYTSQYKHIFSKALFISGLVFILSIILLILFDKSTNDPQFSLSLFFSDTLENTSLACLLINLTQIFNLYETSIDGLSVFFVILTTFLILLCFLEAWTYETYYFKVTESKVREFILYFFILELFLIIAFSTLDLLVFYVFFESVLIPMFLIIGIWGSRERKIKANVYFFLYTLIGSVFMLFSIFVIFFEAYSTKYFILYSISLNSDKELLLLIFSFLAFAVKIPMFPFRIYFYMFLDTKQLFNFKMKVLYNSLKA